MPDYDKGFFWEYEHPKKKHIPRKPEKTWLRENYLPNLDEAKKASWDRFDDGELWTYTAEPLVFDIECFPNYFCVCFKSVVSGKVITFEMSESDKLKTDWIKWIIKNYTLISFNGINYDMPMLTFALKGLNCKKLKKISDELIWDNTPAWKILRSHKIRVPFCDHIDLINVCPLSGSLKTYAARLHTKRIQDLPFPPHTKLTKDQKIIVKWYCVNDLDCTIDVYRFLEKDLRLRENLGRQYGIELRSKSDAQIAESVIGAEMEKLTGMKPQRPAYRDDYGCKYEPPDYLKFQSPILQEALELVRKQVFYVDGNGSIILPEAIKGFPIKIGETNYKIGIGGLHSQEANQKWIPEDDEILLDRDVASYYPFIILNNELFPETLGKPFLKVYKKIVETRLKAKREGDKATSDSLKITINGTYGKLGNCYSILYSPKLLLQVTITGQMSLLYLIEKIEEQGISVVSANTDGVVIKVKQKDYNKLQSIISEWERETNFETEETRYIMLASRSVNDYIALKDDMTCKGKGGLGRGVTKLFKNPEMEICIDAIENFLSKGFPIENTILNCRDITKFIKVRTVKGGGVKGGEYLGKVVRYYLGKNDDNPIVYANSGNKVPKSDGATPALTLPDRFPDDVDFEGYIRATKKMLAEMAIDY